MMSAEPSVDAALDAEGEGHGELASGHEVELGRMVHQLIHGKGDEVDEHDLDHWPQPTQGGPDCHTHDRGLADRGIPDTPGTKLFDQALGGTEWAPKRHILADDHHGIVGVHRSAKAFTDRVDEPDLCRHHT